VYCLICVNATAGGRAGWIAKALDAEKAQERHCTDCAAEMLI
jgi:hypothetical protein